MSYDFLAGRLRQLKMQQRDLARALAMSETSLSHRMTGSMACGRDVQRFTHHQSVARRAAALLPGGLTGDKMKNEEL